jgi:hypothetical protein
MGVTSLGMKPVPIDMHFEFQGVLGINSGQTVDVGWCLFDGEFPDPLIDHTQILRGGPDRHFVEVRRTLEEGQTPGFCRAFFYSIRNLSSDFIFTGQNYIFFRVT